VNVETLKKIPVFAQVSDEALKKIAPFVDLKEVAEGRAIVSEGGYSNELFAIEDGTVKVERQGETLAELGPGDIFGEQGLLEKQGRSATVTATSSVRLLRIGNAELARMKKAMPEVVDELRRRIDER
jgi:CRP/FNR family transcriptional regulator, cyclic AMP receptor protein